MPIGHKRRRGQVSSDLFIFERIINQLDIDHPGRSFCFTMDNLNIHHNQILLDLFTSRGHRYLFGAPYWSVNRPMDYVVNAIYVFLLMDFRNIEDLDNVGDRLDTIIAQIRCIFSTCWISQ